MRIRPDKKENRSFRLPRVRLPDWSLAMFLTLSYVAFLEWVMWENTGGRNIGSVFLLINTIILAFIGWVPPLSAWLTWEKHAKRNRW